MLGQVVPCGGGHPIPLLKTKILVGRKSFCDLTVPHPNVSSRHCEMELRSGYWLVRDLGSTNGTFIDGRPVEEGYAEPGAEIAFANYRYTIEYTSTSDQPPPGIDSRPELMRESLTSKVGIEDAEGAELSKADVWRRDETGGTLGEMVPCGGGEPIRFTKPRMEVGRHGRCDIVLRFPTVSARHCELEFRDGYWFVNDLGSRNGVKVDGAPCQTTALLKPGSILSIAKLRYKIDYMPSGVEPPSDEGVVSLARSLLEKAGILGRGK